MYCVRAYSNHFVVHLYILYFCVRCIGHSILPGCASLLILNLYSCCAMDIRCEEHTLNGICTVLHVRARIDFIFAVLFCMRWAHRRCGFWIVFNGVWHPLPLNAAVHLSDSICIHPSMHIAYMLARWSDTHINSYYII